MFKRTVWIDVLRGYGILFVVWAHHEVDLPHGLVKYLYSFHVAIFIFLSGCVFSPERYPRFRDFLGRRVQTLLVPYFVLSAVTWAVWAGMAVIHQGTLIAPVLRSPLGILLSSNALMMMNHNPPLWFIPCLFMIEIGFFTLWRSLERRHLSWLGWGILFGGAAAAGYLMRLFLPFRPPWGLDTSLTVLGLYGAGFLLRRRIDGAVSALASLYAITLALAIGSLGALLAFSNDFVNLTYNRMGNPLLFYAAAFAGIGAWLLFSRVLPAQRMVRWIGSNTLPILGFHLLAGSVLAKTLLPALGAHGRHFLAETIPGTFILSLLQICALVPLIIILNRFCPGLMGKAPVPLHARVGSGAEGSRTGGCQ